MEQLEPTYGVVTGKFSPMSSVWGVSWGGNIKGYNVGVTVKSYNMIYMFRKHLVHHLTLTYLPKVYKDLDVDALRNFGVFPTFGNFKTKLPTSLNVFTYPYKQWMFYEQHNI